MWFDPALSADPFPAADVYFDTSVLFDTVANEQRLFVASEDLSLRIYEPFVELGDNAPISEALPPAALFDGELVLRPTLRADAAGRLWGVSNLGMLRFDDANALTGDSLADALLEIPTYATNGEADAGVDRAFVANDNTMWIWNEASTRIGVDAEFDDALPLSSASHLIVAGDRVIVAQFGEPKLALYDAATVSEAAPDPIATLPGSFDPSHLYARANLLFVVDVGVLHIFDLDTLELVTQILYDEEEEPVEVIYSSKQNLYIRLPDTVNVWSEVPANPTPGPILLGEGEALGMALQECFVANDCAEGSCVSGLCRP